MKKIVILLLSILASYYIQAQEITVALHHNGAAMMFYGSNAFSAANNTAVSGDTIYLSGNAHYNGVTVTVKLVIIGAGINPDSTTATARTLIESDMSFQAGSDGSVLEGIYTGNNIYIGTDTRVNNVTISRCYLNDIIFNNSFDTTHTCKNALIEQNVITGDIDCDNTDYLIIRNNFIQSRITNVTQNTLIENNIFYYQGYDCYPQYRYVIYNINNSTIRNNIFMLPPSCGGCYTKAGCNNNNIMNNIFPSTGEQCGSNNYTNNYEGIRTDTIFVGETSLYTSFDFSQNYHLKNPSAYPGFNNFGVGVYGGIVPLKEGQLPFNPHIISKTIAPNTDINGHLNISVKVKAQDN
ncbi:MAG: hypothetical protein ABR968_05170 [Bacteroidales bacterium]|jgi:hypothetical protein